MNKISKIPFFFVVGRARSGTTLLRCLFDAHHQISFPLECAFIINLQSKYGKIKIWDEKHLTSFYHDLIRHPQFHFWTIDNEKLLKVLLDLKGENSYGTICKTVYYNFLSFFPKSEIKLLGDKNPAYSLRIKRLLKLFPEAKFIHITRDYRDNVISMIRAKFDAKIYSSSAYRWKYVNNQVLKQKNRLPEKFYTLRYEDLVSRPEFYLKELCSFLGIAFSTDMLNYRAKLDEMLATYPSELINLYHKGLLSPINPDKNYDWKNTLTQRQIKICDTVVGSFAEKSGYERVYKKRDFFTYIGCLPGMLYGRLFYIFMNAINNLPLFLQMRIINLLAIIYKHDWRKFRKKSTDQV